MTALEMGREKKKY